jgi:hypothetical protein
MMRAGRIIAKARCTTGQKSSGLYITCIHSGASASANANPVDVVVVRTQRNAGSSWCIRAASFSAIATSPTLTA